MTGSNRLLMGLGWPVVVLIAVAVANKAIGKPVRALSLAQSNRVELGFLLIAGITAFLIPATGRIHLVFGLALLAWFGFYLYKLTRGDVEEPDLIGAAAAIGDLPDRTRRIVVVTMFVAAAAVVLACAEPFANSLIDAGTELGIVDHLENTRADLLAFTASVPCWPNKHDEWADSRRYLGLDVLSKSTANPKPPPTPQQNTRPHRRH
jgi:Ca2+/Na+ antiporter